jgi:hypothetical protein
MARKNENSKLKKRLIILGGIVLAAILCIALTISFIDKTIHLRSDSPAVEFVTDGDTVICVNVYGRFPYRNIIPTLNENIVQDENGNVVEETRTYTLEAAFSLQLVGTMKIDIEATEDITYIYILNFADKTITIVDGKMID